MLPQMTIPIDLFSQVIQVYRIDVRTVDFNTIEFVENLGNIKGVISSLDQDTFNKDAIDWDLEYYTFHTKDNRVALGDYMMYHGKVFKFVQRKDYSDYGYIRLVGEQVKNSSIVDKLILNSVNNENR